MGSRPQSQDLEHQEPLVVDNLKIRREPGRERPSRQTQRSPRRLDPTIDRSQNPVDR
jgi:hypothetical protein